MSGVLFEKKNRTAHVIINRPEKGNAINYEVRKGLLNAWRQANDDPDILSVIISGAGDSAFSVGQDLIEAAEFRAHEPVKELPLNTEETYGAGVVKPIIAAINGYCLAGGFLLAMNSDIRIACSSAQFGIPEVKWAIPPSFGITPKTAQHFPSGIALELLLLGRTISAEEAYRYGFVNKVVPQQDLLATAEAYANQINDLSPVVIQCIKRAFYMGTNIPPQAIALSDTLAKLARHSDDYHEGFLAFKEKRKPIWKGR